MLKILLLLLSFISISSQSAQFKVVFINPGFADNNTTGDFWSNVTQFMSAAANDLDIELVTFYTQRDHIFMNSLAESVINEQPDFAILVNEKGKVLELIKELTSANIPVFFLLNRLSPSELSLLSESQKSLIKGSVVPDNVLVGQKLIDGLVEQYYISHPKKDDKQNINLLALQGDFTTPASIDREKGLLTSLSHYDNVTLIDSTVANWSEQQAYEKVKGIIKRAPIDIIWAANDPMAVGARRAIAELNLPYPTIIGGVNWDIVDPKSAIDLSFGGHVTLGAYALILLDDIFNHGLTSEQVEQKIAIFESSLSSNYPRYIQFLSENNFEQFDFSQFSYSGNRRLTFSIKNMLNTAPH
ncbi:ABC transporter substrate-binding protein [Thalassotalea piscium]